jgi:hypothetical protein
MALVAWILAIAGAGVALVMSMSKALSQRGNLEFGSVLAGASAGPGDMVFRAGALPRSAGRHAGPRAGIPRWSRRDRSGHRAGDHASLFGAGEAPALNSGAANIMEPANSLQVTSREAWRAWLVRHHATAREVWLLYAKRHTGQPRVEYDAAVEEALCFGWIDGLVRTVDQDNYAQRFTPRRRAASGPPSTGPASPGCSARGR